jgi:hypothetical protein
MISRIENGKKPLESLNVKELSTMIAALDWTAKAFTEATGIARPVIEKTVVTNLSRSSRSIPSSVLTVSQAGRRELEPSAVKIFIDEDWPGDFEVIILDQNEAKKRTIIYQRSSQGAKNQTIIAEVENRGIVIARVIEIQGDNYFLSDENGPFVAVLPRILGVVWRDQTAYLH